MARVEIVTSAANPLLKEVRRASGRGTLTPEGLWVAESFHLLEEAIRTGLDVPVVLVAESARRLVDESSLTRLVVLTDRLFQEIATTQSTQGVMALVRPPVWRMDELFYRESPVVVLDGIQDPGNAGAIVRAAEAFGASGVIFVRGSVSPHNPKTLRAAAGSLFRMRFTDSVDAPSVAAALQLHRRKAWAAMPLSGGIRLLEDVDLERNCALIIGNEGSGVGSELLSVAEGVSIATSNVESLNAAMAAAVLLYEAQRQRVGKAMRA